MMKEFQGVNWDKLRYDNPGEYAAMVQDFQLRQAEIANISTAIEAERAKELDNISKKQQQAGGERFIQSQNFGDDDG